MLCRSANLACTKLRVPYTVTLLNRTPIFEWYMAMFGVMIEHVSVNSTMIMFLSILCSLCITILIMKLEMKFTNWMKQFCDPI